MDLALSARSSATASAKRCTKNRKSQITVPPAEARAWSKTLAIEPMVTEGTYDVRVLKDGWTTVTADGKLAAHYENSILITDGEPEILTVTEGL